jgi:hypothetical protein
MADSGEPSNESPTIRHAHDQKVDRLGARLVEKTGNLQDKYLPQNQNTDDPSKPKKGPAGGYDDTPVPSAPPGYTLRFTFHHAQDLPYADLGTLSADPYIIATLKTALVKRHKADPDLRLRVPTVHKKVNPVWNVQWIVANVPASGFYLKCRLYDEDPADHDDRLGECSVCP